MKYDTYTSPKEVSPRRRDVWDFFICMAGACVIALIIIKIVEALHGSTS